MADQDKQLVRNGQEVQNTLNTKGWKDIIAPMLDKMIEDVIGFKNLDGTWTTGAVNDKRIGEVKIDRLVWYRRALMDFNNHVYSLVSSGKSMEEKLKEAEKPEQMKDPMIDSRYNTEDVDGNIS